MSEDKCVVLDYRSASRKSTYVLYQRGRTSGCVEVITSIEVAILQVIVSIAVQLVGAALGNNLNLRSGIPTVLCIEIVRDKLEFLDRVKTESPKLGTARCGDIARRDVVNRNVVCASARAIGIEASDSKERIVLGNGNNSR